MPVLDISGHKFDVNTDILNGILSAMEQTAKDGKEHGFQMCSTPKGIVKGQDCVGNACAIKLEGCQEIGPVVGDFHSHPNVISFSISDYLWSIEDAKKHPENKNLMCVALKDAGIRCKAVKKIPPEDFSVPNIDLEETREMVKPFFTKKVSISSTQIKELLSGTPWEKLSPEEQIIAIDEGEAMAKKSLIEVAQEYINEPSGKYPWETKTVTMSVKNEDGGVGLEMKGMPTLESDETQFIPTRDIEIPDADLIHFGEAAQYLSAFSPIILTKNKDAGGKYKILDGRHRLVGYRAAGYKQVPVVFSTDTDYK